MGYDKPNEPADFSEVRDRVRDDFGMLRDTLSERGGQLQRTVFDFVDERPLTAVGIAFGVGYLLSGALVSRTTARMISFGGRYVVGRIVREAIAGAGLGFLAGRPEREVSPPSSGGAPAQ